MENILGKTGLTSSEANHVTNVTKELVKNLNVEKLSLATSSITKAGTNYPLDENAREDKWVENIKRVGELFALSAWLKSGIKLKEELLNEVTRKSMPSIELPEYLDNPVSSDLSFEAYLNTLSTKDRAEYLSNESVAAHIGKFIHNFDAVRQASEEFKPTVFQEVKNEVIIIQNKRLYTKDELTDGFFELQKSHREAEKVVNNYKAKHKEWVKNKQDEYSSEHQRIQSLNNAMLVEYNAKVQKEHTEFEAAKREKKKEISNLRIIVPKALQDTLDYVNQYAKK